MRFLDQKVTAYDLHGDFITDIVTSTTGSLIHFKFECEATIFNVGDKPTPYCRSQPDNNAALAMNIIMVLRLLIRLIIALCIQPPIVLMKLLISRDTVENLL